MTLTYGACDQSRARIFFQMFFIIIWDTSAAWHAICFIEKLVMAGLNERVVNNVYGLNVTLYTINNIRTRSHFSETY